MPISANGMTYAPLPMSALMPRCSHLSSTPSIGRIDSRHSRPTMPQIAPQTGRDRIGPSSSGCGCAARLPFGRAFVDFSCGFPCSQNFYPSNFLCDSI